MNKVLKYKFDIQHLKTNRNISFLRCWSKVRCGGVLNGLFLATKQFIKHDNNSVPEKYQELPPTLLLRVLTFVNGRPT